MMIQQQNRLNALERLTYARVKLQQTNPFFGWMVMALKLVEDDKITQTCAVDFKGNLYFNPKWVDKLTKEEAVTLVCHEVGHLFLEHLTRCGDRDHEIWCIANDILVNNLLVNYGFKFSGALLEGLVPKDNKITLKTKSGDIIIDELDKKCSEEVYNILYPLLPKTISLGDFIKGGSFDSHKLCDKLIEKGLINKADVEKIRQQWKNIISEALVYARDKGKLTEGLERFAENIIQSKMNWRQILSQYITREIPSDYNYQKQSKKSIMTGVYMPAIVKDTVDIVIAIDTSGSISPDELGKFISEVYAIGNSFEGVRINLLFWDTQCNNHYLVLKNNMEEVLKSKIEGGGGTDFRGIYDYLKENNLSNAKLLIFLTDMYAEFPKEEEIKTLWVISKNGVRDSNVPYGMFARLDD